MITIGVERFSDYRDEIEPQASAHYAAVGGFSPHFALDVDWILYERYDKVGLLISVVARDDGRIVGYWGGILHGDPHSTFRGKRVRALTQLVLWVDPAYRGKIARRLVREVERVAETLGVSWVLFAVPAANYRAGRFFRTIGYRLVSTDYVKLIGEAADEHQEVARSSASVG